MCGILGVIARPGRFDDGDLLGACATLTHRGPDHSGFTRTRVGGWEVALGHTRLAIVDLDPRSNQPFSWGDCSLVFNGEVYNFPQLREGSDQWRTTSDTEVVAHGLAHEGVGFLERCNGMFALAWLDPHAQQIILARDRMGKKPLYVWRDRDLVAFASEPKALVALGMPTDVDPEARAFYRLMGYFPARLSWYAHAQRVPAGSSLTIELDADLSQREQQYWDPLAASGRTFDGNYEDAKSEFLMLLEDATRLRLNADVPVGVFLSGGIDSSLVALATSRASTRAVKGFTIAVDSAAFDESGVARRTADALGIDICVVDLGPDDFEDALSSLHMSFDEPLADPSQLAMIALSRRAREEVTVVLTGDGGDETFIGYPWISTTAKFHGLSTLARRFPAPLRQLAATSLSSPWGMQLLRGLVMAAGLNVETLDTKRHILLDVLSGSELGRLYDHFRVMTPLRHLEEPHAHALPLGSMLDYARRTYPGYSWGSLAERSDQEVLSALDLVTYMRDDVLVKVDRATMFASLEARSPLLDYRLVEFAASLPLEFKVHEGVHKRLLRDVLAENLPGDLAGLAKRGFGVPLPYGVMPDGPTPASRYVRFQDQNWFKHWS